MSSNYTFRIFKIRSCRVSGNYSRLMVFTENDTNSSFNNITSYILIAAAILTQGRVYFRVFNRKGATINIFWLLLKGKVILWCYISPQRIIREGASYITFYPCGQVVGKSNIEGNSVLIVPFTKFFKTLWASHNNNSPFGRKPPEITEQVKLATNVTKRITRTTGVAQICQKSKYVVPEWFAC